MKPIVSVIIRCKDEERFIGQTLRAVFDQETKLPFEVVVIDSGSTDRTLDIVREFDVRLYEIQPGRFTFGHALNYGAGLAEGDYIINLSAHCIPVNSKWMANLLGPLFDEPSVAATFGRQEPIMGLNPFEEITLLADFPTDENARVVPVFSNSNCAIDKKIWQDHPFDEKAVFAEDYIWAIGLPPEHAIRYAHDSSVYHSHPLTVKYWSARFHMIGQLQSYLELVYGISWPWGPPIDVSGNRISRSLSSRLYCLTRKLLKELRQVAGYTVKHGYYRHALISPLFIIMRSYCFRKGTIEGATLYGNGQNK